MVFDLFKKQTFNNLNGWLQEVDKHGKTDVEIVVIANKSDLVDAGQTPEVSESDIAEFEQKTGKKVYMASAKNGQNVESTFLKLTETLITKHKP